MTPLQVYDDMTDQDLIDFVAAWLPKALHRIQHKPRYLLCKETILDKIRERGYAMGVERKADVVEVPE